MKRERLTKKVELPFDYTYAPKCECIEMGSTVTFGQMLAYDGVCAKLGQLEDIEERLSKYKKIGISGLVDLFKNLTDEDIEYIVQLSFKKRKIIYDIHD